MYRFLKYSNLSNTQDYKERGAGCSCRCIKNGLSPSKTHKNKAGGSFKTGCISGDCKNGTGTFMYADTSYFTGTFINGGNGKGIYTLRSGATFKGEFEGAILGKGDYYSSDGKEITSEAFWQTTK